MKTIELILLTIIIQGGLLLAGVLFAWYLEIPVWNKIHFLGYDIFLGVGIGLLIASFTLHLLNMPWKFLDSLKRDADLACEVLGRLNIPLILFVSIAAGISEEIFFRGVLQIYLSDIMGVYSGILLTSIIFGLLHFVSISYVTFVTILSCLFGLIYVWTGNLLIVILAHLIYDLVVLVWGIHIKKEKFFS